MIPSANNLAIISMLAAFIHLGRGTSAAQPAPVPVDGVVALVGGATPGPGVLVVLRSDVEMWIRLDARHGVADPVLPEEFDAALSQIVGELLIQHEATRVRLSPPTEAALLLHRARLATRAGGEAAFDARVRELEASTDEIAELVRRQSIVASFLEANLEGSTVVSDAEVRAAYDSGQHPFLGQGFEDVRDLIRSWLATQAMHHALERWVTVLRARITVHLRGGAHG